MAKKKKKKSQKNPGKFRKFFFSIFPKFFSIEIILRECRLRTQNFMTLGLTVSEIQGVTNIRTDRLEDLLYRLYALFFVAVYLKHQDSIRQLSLSKSKQQQKSDKKFVLRILEL